MWMEFGNLLKKDFRMMLFGRFFLLTFISLMLYSCYINFFYANLEQESYQVYLFDPQNRYPERPKYITNVNQRQEFETACKDRISIGIDASTETPEIYMLSSGIDTLDKHRAAWAEMILTENTGGKAEIIGSYNKEQKSRREITAEFLFFEIAAVGFLGLASVLFKERQMGVIRVHGILPVHKAAFILSKLVLFLLSDLVFAAALTWLNIGIADSLAILPQVLVQTGILSLMMVLIGFLCAVWIHDFKQFSLFYLVLAVFVTSPVFLAGQAGIGWNWLSYHPVYHLFMAVKDAYFGMTKSSPLYYFAAFGTIVVLFRISYGALSHELAKEG